MTKNTQERIISAFVLVGIFVGCFLYGRISFFFLAFSVGALAVHEIELNFFNQKQGNFHYIFSQLLFASFFYSNFFLPSQWVSIMIILGVLQCLFLLCYLFMGGGGFKNFYFKIVQIPGMGGFFLGIPFFSIAHIISEPHWRSYVIILCLAVSGMDIMAWFWGRRLGKTKLCPSVSPNKTLEGFIGGALSTMFMLCAVVFLLDPSTFPWKMLILALLVPFSHMGDLIQSKLKRLVGIKDSSSLIPGHGGIYDRVDSIIFTAPFMALLVRLSLLW